MNILIVENEKPAADKLQHLLHKFDENIRVAGVIETVEGTVNWLQNNPSPDLILLDIQLDDGICFEIFETIKVDIPVIFTTAYDEYTLQAFKVNSVDYLLKPIKEESLQKALNKFKTFHYQLTGDLIKRFLGDSAEHYKSRFLVKIGSHYKSVPISDISCFYILNRATFIKTTSVKDYSVDPSLESIQKTVDPLKFFRINRNCIVHINAISDMISYSSSRLQIRLNDKMQPVNEEYLVVSREKVNEFKKWVDR